jgi:ABC-type bacteriocin/lantibiotic exporter with double-glycine peptidase domain
MPSKPPFFRQERSDTCMLACLRMLLAYRGQEVTEIALAENVTLEEGGLDPDQLAALARGYGLKAEARRLDAATIADLVRLEKFPIVLVDRSFLDREFSIHAVIPIRFSRQCVWVLDPLRGERRLSQRKFVDAQRRVGRWGVVWEPGAESRSS